MSFVLNQLGYRSYGCDVISCNCIVRSPVNQGTIKLPYGPMVLRRE